MRNKLTRRERRELELHQAAHVEEIQTVVQLRAATTVRELAGPTKEQVDHWFRYSYGAWKPKAR